MKLMLTAAACLIPSMILFGCAEETPEPTPDAADTHTADVAADTAPQIEVDATPAANPMIFVTNTRYPLAGGLAGLDSLCMGDSNRPTTATFKALVGAPTRSICTDAACAAGPTPIDWVLKANTTYTRADGTVLFTTTADAIIDWPMAASLTEAGYNQASGLNKDWTVRTDLHCDDWTSVADQEVGVGWTKSTDDGFLDGGKLKCHAKMRFVCVEQR